MNENLNLSKILNDVPAGTKLWSPICGDCELAEINYDTANIANPRITVLYKVPGSIRNKALFFDNYGVTYNCPNGECLLFPSRTNHDWSTFNVPKKHKEFKPFQKVLTPGIIDNVYYWFATLYSHYDEKHKFHMLIDNEAVHDDKYIIPYDGNDKLLGTRVDY